MIPVVLIHGIRLSGAAWTEVVDHLPRDRVVAPIDLPGHGRRRGEPFSFASATAAVHDAIDAVGGRAIVVGHSLGGYVAMAAAAHEPDHVAGLVVAGATCVPRHGATAPFLVAHRVLSTWSDGGERVSARVLRAALPRRTVDAIAHAGIASEVIPDVVAGLRAARPLEHLAAYPGPVRFVNGRLDHLRLEERRFAEAASRASLVVTRGGHYLPMTRPRAFARMVESFVQEVDAAVPASS